MNDSVEAVTLRALSLALDATAMRQQAIAANIANAETEGYAPLRVDFESQLEGARRQLALSGTLDAGALEGVSPRLVAERQVGQRVQLDAEMAAMASNAVQHQALALAVSRQFSIYAMAVNDGRK